MKRLSLLFTAILLTSAVVANPIDLAKAKALAQEYLTDRAEPTLCHAAKARKAGCQTPPYYVFSRGEGQGYVIVAGDDCIPPIIGYTESGDFDESKEAPQLLAMLDHYAQLVETLQAERRNTPYDGEEAVPGPRRAPAGRIDVPILLTTHWHQSAPYSDMVPKLPNGNRALVGCVATAGSQVFYYWRRDLPDAVPATTPTYDYGAAPATAEYQIKAGTPLKWELMCNNYTNQPAEYKEAVAVLCAAVGMQGYLEYGESTGGYIWNLPYDLYNLRWQQANKDDNFSDDTWSALIYSELKKGRPVVYSGYLEDWEGHALVIDGYKASGDLFHFNYGWGGQSDGFYTVRALGSGNQNIDFAMSPTVIYGIRPKKQNINVGIQTPEEVYASVTNTLTVKVTNRSTIPASGFYLFANKSGQAPTKLSDAQSSETTTEVGVDETKELTLTATPPAKGTCHLFITDEDLHVLASKTVTAVEGVPDLWVEGMHMTGNAETERYGGDDYRVTFHTSGTLVVRLHNKSAAAFERNLRVRLWSTEDEGATWKELGMKAAKAVVAPGEVADVPFAIASSSSTPVKEGIHYRVTMVEQVPSTNYPIHFEEGSDTAAYFVLKTPDLVVDAYEEGVMRLSGHWDPTLFASNTMARMATYADAVAYDLTKVEGVDSVLLLDVNPNALYLVAEGQEVKGVNVVSDGFCQNLVLTPGFSFAPQGGMNVADASISLQGKVGKWHLLTTPFEAAVPDGIIARRIDGHSNSGIIGNTTDVKVLEAGKTYMVMTSHQTNQTLAATTENGSTPVSVSPVPNADPALVGTYANIVAPEDAMAPNDNDSQSFAYLVDGDQVEALRGYFAAEDITRAFSTNADLILDPAYRNLALGIEEAYGILEKYRTVVEEEAYEEYLNDIQEAEWLFSNRAGSSLNTAPKVNAYAEELLAKGDAYMRRIVRPGNVEVDFTANIKNPSFEAKTTAGWTLTKPLNTAITSTTAAKVYGNAAYNHFTAYADGDYILSSSYVYVNTEGVRDTLGVGISQEVEGLVPGYYRLTACLASDEGNTISLLAGDSTVTFSAHPFGRHYFNEVVVDSIKVVPGDDGTGTLLIGVAPGKWFKADHFRLTFIGAIEESQDPDIVENVTTRPRPAAKGIYTIQGQRVTRITKPGIYIIDGKKKVVR